MDVSKSVAFPRMGVSINILFHPISWLRLKLAPESESAPLRPWGDQHSNHWPRIQSHRTLQQHSLRSSTPTVKNPLASTHSRARKEGKVTKKKYQMRDARGNTKLSCSPSERITRWEDARRMLAQAVPPSSKRAGKKPLYKQKKKHGDSDHAPTRWYWASTVGSWVLSDFASEKTQRILNRLA